MHEIFPSSSQQNPIIIVHHQCHHIHLQSTYHFTIQSARWQPTSQPGGRDSGTTSQSETAKTTPSSAAKNKATQTANKGNHNTSAPTVQLSQPHMPPSGKMQPQPALNASPHVAGSTPTRGLSTNFSATPTTHSDKYCLSKKSLFQLRHQNLPDNVRKDLEGLGAHGLTDKTWSSYNTAKKMLALCCKQNGLKKELPVPETTILIFIHWLATVRNLKSGTISNYLAGIRQFHIANGMPDPGVRTETVNLILKGTQNKEARNRLANRATVKQPVTEASMLTLKANLRHWNESPTNHRLIWAVATNLYHGLFRVRELLSEKETEFDPAFTLLTDDIKTSDSSQHGSIHFQLKAPKEDKKNRTKIVDVYGTGNPTCPVRAMAKWQAKMPWPANQPAFRWQNGTPLTAKKFNQVLKEHFGPSAEGTRAFSSHCFRIGAASRLGHLGYSDEDVQAMGRWSSRAFEEYLLHPRTKRAAIAKQAMKS